MTVIWKIISMFYLNPGLFPPILSPCSATEEERERLGAWHTVKVKTWNYRKTLKMSETESKIEIFLQVGKKPWSGIRSSNPAWTLPGITLWHLNSCPGQAQHLQVGWGAAFTQQWPECRSSKGAQLPRMAFPLAGHGQWQAYMLRCSTHISTGEFVLGKPAPTLWDGGMCKPHWPGLHKNVRVCDCDLLGLDISVSLAKKGLY